MNVKPVKSCLTNVRIVKICIVFIQHAKKKKITEEERCLSKQVNVDRTDFLEVNLSLAFILRGQNKALGLKVSNYHPMLLFGGSLQDDIQMQQLLVYSSIFFSTLTA